MKSMLFIALCALFFLTADPLSAATPTDRCHCFKVRTYDPANKFAADDYLLTSSYNSLVAVTLGISKRQIIMMMMQGGVAPNDLLIAQFISRRTGVAADLMLSDREAGAGWPEIMQSKNLADKTGSDPILAAVASGRPEKEITALVTDAMIESYYSPVPEQLRKLRAEKFSNKEIGLIFALNRQTLTSFEDITAMSRVRKMSWGEIANQLKLTIPGVGKTILGARS